MTRLIEITGKVIAGEWGEDDLAGEGIPVLRTTNFTNIGVVNYDNIVTRIIKKKNLKDKLLRYGDIIIEKSGGSDTQPVGRVIFFEGEEEKYLFNNFTGLLRVKNRNLWNPKYVFYTLFANYAKGMTVPYENRTTGLHNLQTDSYINATEVINRGINEQNKIVYDIDKVVELINLHKKQLKDLDIIIKSRFIEMFGSVAQDSLKFPIKKLGTVSDVGSSHRVFTHEFVEEGIPFYRGTEIGELAAGKQPLKPFYITEEHYSRLIEDGTRPMVGDLLMPSICNKGQIWMVDTRNPFYYKDGRVLSISPNRDIFNSKYLQYYLREKTIVEYPKMGSGSTFAEFKIFLLKDLDVAVPPIKLQNQFADFVAQVDKSKLAVQQSLNELETLKKSLMQQYFG